MSQMSDGGLIFSADIQASILQLNKDISNIENKLKNIDVKLNIDKNQMDELAKQVVKNSSEIAKSGEKIGKDLSSSIINQFTTSFHNSGADKIKSDIEKSFGNVGDIKFNWVKNAENDIKSLTAVVNNSKGIVEKFKYILNSKTDTFDLVSITGTDAGLPRIDTFISKTMKEFTEFRKVNSEIWTGLTDEINKFNDELKKLQNDGGGHIEEVTKAFNDLKMSANTITTNLKQTTDGLNVTTQAVAKIEKMPTTIQKLSNTFASLKEQPMEVGNQLNNLTTQLNKVKEVESTKGRTKEWSEEYAVLSKQVQEVTNKINLLKNAEKGVQDTQMLDTKRNNLLSNLDAYRTQNSKLWSSHNSDAKELIATYNQLREAIKQCSNASDFTRLSKEVSTLKNNIKEAGYATKSLKDVLKEDFSKFAQFYGVGAVTVGFTNSIRESVNELVELDSILTEISKTSNLTTQELDKLGASAYDSASKYGRTATDYLTSVQEMSRSGFYGKQAEDMAELSLILQSAGSMNEELSDKFILSTNAAYSLGGSIEDLMGIIDGCNEITNRNSVNMTDLSTAISTAGSMAGQTGVKVNELASLISTAVARTKKEGSEVGTALKSIFINLQNVNSDKIFGTFDDLGLSMTKVVDGAKRLKTPIELLKELSQVYNDLPTGSIEKSTILTNIGGKHYANVLSSILSGYEDYENMLQDYSEGSGSALEESRKSSENMQGSLNKLKNSVTEFYDSFINRHEVADFIQMLAGGVNVITDFVNSIGAIPTALGGLSIITSARQQGGLFDFKSFSQMTSTIKEIGNGSSDIDKVAKSINGLTLAQSKAVLSTSTLTNEEKQAILINNGFSESEVNKALKIKASNTEMQLATSGVSKYTSAVRTGMLKASVSVKAFGTAMLTTLKVTAMAMLTNPFTWISVGVTLFSKLKSAIDKANPSLETMRENLEKQSQKYSDAKTEVESLEKKLQTLQSKIIEINSMNGVTVSKEGELKKLQEQTKEMEAQLVIARENAKLEGAKTEKDALKVVNKPIRSEYKTLDKDLMPSTSYSKNSVASNIKTEVTPLEEVNLAMAEYNRLAKEQSELYKKQELISDKTSDEYLKLSKNIENYSKSMESARDRATKIMGSLKKDTENNITGFTPQGEEFLNQYNDLSVFYKDWIGNINEVAKANDNLAQSQNGVNNATNNTMNEETETDSDSFDAVNDLRSEYEELQKIKDKLNQGKLSKSDVIDLVMKFKELSPYVDITAENFGNLSEGLKKIGEAKLNAIVNQLEAMLSIASDEETRNQIQLMIDTFNSFSDIKQNDSELFDIQDFSDAVSSLKEVQSLYKDFKQNITDKEVFTFDIENIEKLRESFGDLGFFSDFESILTDTSSTVNEVESAFSSLFNEYANTKLGVENVTSANRDLIISQLELKGATKESATAFVDYYLDLAEARDFCAKSSVNLENMTQSSLTALLKEAEVAGIDKKAILDYYYQKLLVDGFDISTDTAIESLIAEMTQLGLNCDKLKDYIALKNAIATGTGAGRTSGNTNLGSGGYSPHITPPTDEEVLTPPEIILDLPKIKEPKTSSGSKPKDTKQKIDYITQTLNVLQNNVDKAKTSLEDLGKNGSKNYFNDQAKAIKKVNGELKDLKDGYKNAKTSYDTLYNKELNKLGKDKNSIKKKIESGEEFSIKSYGKDKADTIKSAMDYYNKMQDSNEKIKDITQEIKDNERTLIQNSLDQLEYDLEAVDSKLGNDGITYVKSNSLLKEKESLLKQQYNLNKKLAKSDEERLALEDEYKASLKEINDLKYQNELDARQNSIDLQQDTIDYIQDEIDKRKELGDTIEASDYDGIILRQNNIKKSYESMYDSMTKKLNDLVAKGSIKQFSPEWYEWQKNLQECQDSIQGINNNLEDTAKAIYNIKWDNFTNGINKINNFNSEVSDVASMLGEIKIDDDGSYTKDGVTALALYGKQVSINRALVNKYNEALKVLEKDYKNGKISQAEYTEKVNEYTQAMRDSAKATKEAEDSIISLKVEALEQEKTAFGEIIDKQKEYLQNELEAYKLANKQNEMNQSLARLKAKQRLLEMNTSDTDRTNMALLAQIKNEITKKEKEQEEQLFEDRNKAEQDALDESKKNFDEVQDEKIKLLKTSTAERERVLRESQARVESQFDTVLSNINTLADQYGMTLSDTITSPWINAQAEVQKYMDMVGQLQDVSPSNVNDKIQSILKSGDGQGKNSSTLNKTIIASGGTGLSYKQMAELANLLSIGGKNSYVADEVKNNTNLKNLILQALISGGYLDSSNKEVKNVLKKLGGFKDGGVVSKIGERIRLNGDSLMVGINGGEGVLNPKNMGIMEKFSEVALPVRDIVSMVKGINTRDMSGQQDYIINCNSLLNIEGNFDDAVFNKTKNWLLTDGDRIVGKALSSRR